MKLAILGATGQTGVCLVRQALEAKHHVIAAVRNPDKLTVPREENLRVEKVDIFSTESLKPVFEGCDAVLSSIGAEGLFSTITVYSESIKSIIAAMRETKVKRLICITSWYIEVDPNDDPGRVARWVVRPMIKNILKDMGTMEQYLAKECSDIDYTTVRPAQLSNDKLSDKELVVEERFFAKASFKIPRENVAKFMLQCLTTDQHNKKMLAIGLPS